MFVYKSIYIFQVLGAITSGKIVYVLDREKNTTFTANELPVDLFLSITNSDNEDNRYDFWVVEKKEEETEKENAE